MTMRGKKFSPSAMAAVILVGCTNTRGGGNSGMKGGWHHPRRVGGAVVGSQFGKGDGQLAIVATGTLSGAFLGNQIGQSLDKADAMYASTSPGRSGPLRQRHRAPQPPGVTPIRAIRAPLFPNLPIRPLAVNICRELTKPLTLVGARRKPLGTACRQPDGSWRIVQ
jgi:surface antigen